MTLYVSGGLVTFDDSRDLGFSFGSVALTYPAVLALVHRILALVVVLAWLASTAAARKSSLYAFFAATSILMVAQSLVGAAIVQDFGGRHVLNYLVLTHFSLSGLTIIAAGLTLVGKLSGR